MWECPLFCLHSGEFPRQLQALNDQSILFGNDLKTIDFFWWLSKKSYFCQAFIKS